MFVALARIFLLLATFQSLPHDVGASQLGVLKDHLIGEESLEMIGIGKRRIAYRIRGTDLLIKVPKELCVLTPLIQCECIFYEISEQLHFGVVPFIHYASLGSEEASLIATRCPTLMQPMVLQRYITPSDAPLDIEHAHKVIFFNWITGRYDATRENSIVDAAGKVWEVDNEIGGGRLKRRVKVTEEGQIDEESHWLLGMEEVKGPISEALLAWILDLPDQIELGKEFLSCGFQENVICFREKMLNSNLKFLKTVIRYLQSQRSTITFELLKQTINTLPDER
jgi:hypothetical protein